MEGGKRQQQPGEPGEMGEMWVGGIAAAGVKRLSSGSLRVSISLICALKCLVDCTEYTLETYASENSCLFLDLVDNE